MPDFDQALGAPRRRQSGTDSAQRRQSLTEAARAEHWLGRILRHYGERAPFINFFYYLFFRYRSSPKYADILGQLEGMLLFSALMFTIAVSLPMALERDELLMAERDYHHGGVHGCTVEPGERFPCGRSSQCWPVLASLFGCALVGTLPLHLPCCRVRVLTRSHAGTHCRDGPRYTKGGSETMSEVRGRGPCSRPDAHTVSTRSALLHHDPCAM